MKPMILLTGSHSVTDTGRPSYQVNQEYAEAVRLGGGLPLLCLDANHAEQYAGIADGLLLTGGPDIAPQRYHQDKVHETTNCDCKRDALEWDLFDAFVKAGKPVFGICRGLQLINVYFGGTLHQHLPEVMPQPHTKGAQHGVQLSRFTLLAGKHGCEITVNSYHHQGIERLGQDLAAAGLAGSLIEAIEHKKLPVWAVQWHPERMIDAADDMLPLFCSFITACK